MAIFNVNFVFALLIAHWVADFVCQNRWMAINKCSNIKALSLHVAIYTIVFALLMGITPLYWNHPTELFLSWILINCVLHFITDFFTSKATKFLFSFENKHYFFVMIGFDQLIHYGCLLYSFSWFYMR
jgi:hypothetical protein